MKRGGFLNDFCFIYFPIFGLGFALGSKDPVGISISFAYLLLSASFKVGSYIGERV